MNVRQTKRALHLAAMLLGIAGVVLVAYGLMAPVEVEASNAGPPGGASGARPVPADGNSAHASADAPAPRLGDLMRLCQRDLRRPLFDEPKPEVNPAAAATGARSPLSARLIGTAIERGHSMALFQQRDGRAVACPVGGSFDDAGGPVKVTAIDGRQVTVEYAGRPHTLQLPPPRPDLIAP